MTISNFEKPHVYPSHEELCNPCLFDSPDIGVTPAMSPIMIPTPVENSLQPLAAHHGSPLAKTAPSAFLVIGTSPLKEKRSVVEENGGTCLEPKKLVRSFAETARKKQPLRSARAFRRVDVQVAGKDEFVLPAKLAEWASTNGKTRWFELF